MFFKNQNLLFLSLILPIVACQPGDKSSSSKAILEPNIPFNVIDQSHWVYESVGVVSSDAIKGTAFFVGKNLLVTNHHLTESCDLSHCDLLFNGKYHVNLVARRLYPDVALLRVVGLNDEINVKALALGNSPEVDEPISVVQDVGLSDEVEGPKLSIDSGRVLVKSEEVYWSEIGYTVNTQPGSSGAAILNAKGEVVGIHKGYSNKNKVNIATTVDSIALLLAHDLVAEFNLLIDKFEKLDDDRVKYDLVQIYLEADASDPSALNKIRDRLCTSQKRSSLKFYFSKIRKINIECL